MLLGKNNPNKITGSGKVSTDILVKPQSHGQGPMDAKVTVVEFGDYECPACKAAQPIVDQVLSEYKDKIRYVFRNYPLSGHQYAFGAAQAAEAAALQGKFWEMHSLLYEKSPDLAKDQLFADAKSLNLDMDKFTKDYDSDAVKQTVLNDQSDGNAAGLTATPTFFINGTQFTGVLPLSQFESEINSRLK